VKTDTENVGSWQGAGNIVVVLTVKSKVEQEDDRCELDSCGAVTRSWTPGSDRNPGAHVI
jgi:hypothetical protein